MKCSPALLCAIAGTLLAAGCASPVAREAAPAKPVPAAAAPPVPVERVTRYYRDEQGALWDDRGHKLDRPP